MAFGTGTINAFGGAVSDLFAAQSQRTKAAGSRLEAGMYDRAAQLALQNEQFAKTSTAIKQVQLQRSIYQTLGQQQADVAASGFAASGSSMALLRDSAAQGALTKAVASQQGLIEQAGYHQQADSYNVMAQASRMAAENDESGSVYANIGAGIKLAAGIATLL